MTNNAKKIYTCPMHPEVERDKPGLCPECGMNLIPAKKEMEMDHFAHESALTITPRADLTPLKP